MIGWLILGVAGASLGACMQQQDAVADTGRALDTAAVVAAAGSVAATAPVARTHRARSQANGAPAEHAAFLPDSARTPGATFPVTQRDVCTPGYARAVRNVPSSEKRAVYASYGVTHRDPGEYEMDHLIPLELGGSNSTRNLWPQSYRTQPWNAASKNALENRLHSMVCRGAIPLARAQHEIATDWVAAYLAYVHPYPPKPRATRAR